MIIPHEKRRKSLAKAQKTFRDKQKTKGRKRLELYLSDELHSHIKQRAEATTTFGSRTQTVSAYVESLIRGNHTHTPDEDRFLDDLAFMCDHWANEATNRSEQLRRTEEMGHLLQYCTQHYEDLLHTDRD